MPVLLFYCNVLLTRVGVLNHGNGTGIIMNIDIIHVILIIQNGQEITPTVGFLKVVYLEVVTILYSILNLKGGI